MTLLQGRPEEVAEIWRFLGDLITPSGLEAQSASFFGITRYYDGQDERSAYFAGFEPDHLGAGSMLASLILPAEDYISITYDAPLAALPLTWDYLYHTWLPKAGLQPAFPIEVVALGAASPWLERPVRAVLSLPVRKADHRG